MARAPLEKRRLAKETWSLDHLLTSREFWCKVAADSSGQGAGPPFGSWSRPRILPMHYGGITMTTLCSPSGTATVWRRLGPCRSGRPCADRAESRAPPVLRICRMKRTAASRSAGDDRATRRAGVYWHRYASPLRRRRLFPRETSSGSTRHWAADAARRRGRSGPRPAEICGARLPDAVLSRSMRLPGIGNRTCRGRWEHAAPVRFGEAGGGRLDDKRRLAVRHGELQRPTPISPLL